MIAMSCASRFLSSSSCAVVGRRTLIVARDEKQPQTSGQQFDDSQHVGDNRPSGGLLRRQVSFPLSNDNSP
jgi:hypothetical protein